jgi:hypothetical protein
VPGVSSMARDDEDMTMRRAETGNKIAAAGGTLDIDLSCRCVMVVFSIML